MTTLHAEALVLRVVDFGESDRIVRLLTPATARLTAIAKGAKRSRRRFSGALDLFHHLAVQVERRRPASMARLEHARLIDEFPALRSDPRRFALACYLSELVDRLAPEGAGPREAAPLFRAALEAQRAVADRPPGPRLRALLELRLLDAMGLRPELRRCVRCGGGLGGPRPVDFHVAEGGPVCGACRSAADSTFAVHLGTLHALDRGLRWPLAHLDRLGFGAQALAEAGALLERFRHFHVGVDLRSEPFLDAVLAPAVPPPRA